MSIGSINHAISFLGVRGAARQDGPNATEGRRRDDRIPSRPTAIEEPAFVTEFSAEALERAASQEPGRRETTDTLSSEERAEVRKLQQRDQEVRRHEQAHKAAAGKLAPGGPNFSYARGPDGKQYISGGEVQIDVSSVAGDPQATIQKMRQVQSAARAPANPSGADRKVAAAAAKQESAARAELRKENTGESTIIPRERSRELPAAYRQTSERRSGDQLNLLA